VSLSAARLYLSLFLLIYKEKTEKGRAKTGARVSKKTLCKVRGLAIVKPLTRALPRRCFSFNINGLGEIAMQVRGSEMDIPMELFFYDE